MASQIASASLASFLLLFTYGTTNWARELQSRGYSVRLIPPQFVVPYVKSNKNDANDAEAICEAMSRPSMRFVSVKRVEQQDIQATHRIR